MVSSRLRASDGLVRSAFRSYCYLNDAVQPHPHAPFGGRGGHADWERLWLHSLQDVELRTALVVVVDMTFKQAVTARTNRIINVAHRTALRLSGGRLGARVMGMEAVEVHTTGRKSGQRRSVMLIAPVIDSTRVVLVTSKGGEVRHPDWYHNLIACPDVEITHRGTTTAMRAHTSDELEKEELMPLIVAAFERYPRYQARDEDDVAVIVCEPR